MNFLFEWQERYLMSERSKRVRYHFRHENIKFISFRYRVMFCTITWTCIYTDELNGENLIVNSLKLNNGFQISQ